MKTIARVMLGTVCIWLTGIVSAYGVNYTFESGTSGWTLGGDADRKTPGAHSGTYALNIPASGGSALSANLIPGTSEVTDFWTKPNPVTTDPTATSDASVQFAFDSDAGNKVRVLNGDTWTTADAGATVDGSAWLHVTVIKNSSTWTLEINGSPVGETYAIHTVVTAQSGWLSVANGSGSAALLDDVEINVTGSDSKIASVSVSGGNVAGTVSAAAAQEIRAFDDYLCTTPAGGRLVTLGGTDPDKTFTDADFSGAAVYYKLATTGGAMESTPSFAAHGSARGAASDYWVGVPVDYAPGEGALLTGEGVNGVFGDQLASGLTGNNTANDADQVWVFDPSSVDQASVYYLNLSGKWAHSSGPPLTGTEFGAGAGLYIHRANTGSGRTVLAGKVYSGAATVDVAAGLVGDEWSMISHPFSSGAQRTAVASIGGQTGDSMIINNGGQYRTLIKSSSGWRLSTGGVVPSGWDYLNLGAAALYKPVSGTTTLTFSP